MREDWLICCSPRVGKAPIVTAVGSLAPQTRGELEEGLEPWVHREEGSLTARSRERQKEDVGPTAPLGPRKRVLGLAAVSRFKAGAAVTRISPSVRS